MLSELPPLLAGLPRAWGHITSVTVNGATWSAMPGRMWAASTRWRWMMTSCVSASRICGLSPLQG
ncbi:DUF5994 family protein [Streptomyces sp. NPDC047725]|uniref:DUF5994 family protein n=1 Tax=Streptomyces sp. NPDC047725 TaxID=3365487 RepID=UPI00371E5658